MKISKNTLGIAAIAVLAIIAALVYCACFRIAGEDKNFKQGAASRFLKNSRFEARTPPAEIGSFSDEFYGSGTLDEAGALYESKNPNWWVNSGGRLSFDGNAAKTIRGGLSGSDRWLLEYLRYNPRDTDNGTHPQNVFRLVQTNKWKNFFQQVYVKIDKVNLSESPNRNASNGVFLFNRYQTGDDLYYTGLRVDGAAVIKKKIDGMYHTLAYKQLFHGDYERYANPNLLPQGTWMGIRSEVATQSDDSVSIRLYADIGKTGRWTLVLEARDDGAAYGGRAILDSGYAGIRTDFMDAEFSSYRIEAVR